MKLLLWIEVQSMPSAMEHIIQMSTTELLAAVYVLNPTFRDIFAHFGQYSCDFTYDIRCELRIIQQLHVSPKKKVHRRQNTRTRWPVDRAFSGEHTVMSVGCK